MSDLTPELNLSLAVVDDDTSDYLTLPAGLRGSLSTIDGLFNSSTGHTHNGAHQGGALSFQNLTIAGNLTVNGTSEFKQGVNCDTTLHVVGDTVLAGVTATSLHVTGATNLDGGIANLTVTSNLTVGGNIGVSGGVNAGASTIGGVVHSGGNLVLPSGNYVNGTTSGGASYPMLACSGDNMTGLNVGPGGQLYIANSGNTARVVTIDNSGDLTLNGWLKVPNNSYVQWSDTTHRIQAGSQNVMQFYEAGNLWQFLGNSGYAMNLSGDGASYFTWAPASGGGNVRFWGSGLLSLNNSVLVGGGTDVHGFNFYVAGTAGGLAGWNATSSEAVKANVTTITPALAWQVINDETLQGLHYTRTDMDNLPQFGFSADKWVQVVPEAVSLDDTGAPVAMDYAMVTPFLFAALKDVSERLAKIGA